MYNTLYVTKRMLHNHKELSKSKGEKIMPPKPKYTKEQIVNAALEVVAEKGVSSLTAKELAAALDTSTSPIFTVFDTMAEVLDEVKAAAMSLFESYAHKTDSDMPAFKRIGMQMILFAKEKPNLYRLIFMSPNENVHSFDDIYARLGSVADECLLAIRTDYGLTDEKARALFEHSWIHTFGIGALCATGMCDFSEEQVSKMLTRDFTAMLLMLKSETEKTVL